MDKQQRLEALLKHHTVSPREDINFAVFPSKYTPFQDQVFDKIDNFTAEEIASHQFILTTGAANAMSLNQAAAIVYPISLAVITAPQLPDQIAAAMIDEISKLRALHKPLVFLSLFDFSLGCTKRTTPIEHEVEELVQRTQRLDRLKFLQGNDRIVQFESSRDLDQNCTVFPLSFTPLVAPSVDREWLFCFVGKTTKEHWLSGFVRSPEQQVVWEKLRDDYQNCSVIGDSSELTQFSDGVPFYDIPAKSTFTLCPRGIGNWTFRLYEAILSGSIPVIMSDSFIPPYPGLNWQSFSLWVAEKELPNIGQRIEQIPQDQIEEMQRALRAVQARFTGVGLRDLFVDWMHEHY